MSRRRRGIVVTDMRIVRNPFALHSRADMGPLPKFVTLHSLRHVSQRIRRYAVYWDRIDYPTCTRYGHIRPDPPEIAVLKQEGLLTESEVNIRAQGYKNAHGKILYGAFLQNEAKEPGCWSMAQEGISWFFDGTDAQRTRLVEVELCRALLEPSTDVPMEKILRFKEDRASELFAFRAAMDEMYKRIVDSKDIPRTKQAELDRAERAIRDINTAMSESLVTRVMKSVKVELGLGQVTSALVGEVLGGSFGVPILGGAIGFAAAAVKFQLSLTKRMGVLPESARDFLYVYDAQQTLGGNRR